MQRSRFTWDKIKDMVNTGKHKIDFHEASTVFKDPNIIVSFDDEHSIYEDRFIAIGMSEKTNLLMVCHCYRDGDNVIRIISARKATKNEAAIYKGGKS